MQQLRDELQAIEAGGADWQNITYEGYGPGGVAIMVACMTHNRNRTVADIRHAFARHGGSLGAAGSVAYLFNPVGMLSFAPGLDQERLLAAALDAGGEDLGARARAFLAFSTMSTAEKAAIAGHPDSATAARLAEGQDG